MKSISQVFAALAATLTISSHANADTFGLEVGLNVAYMLAGGGAHGHKAPATGGAAIVPTGRVLYRLPYVDPYFAASPILLTPYSLDATSFIGAVDAGLSLHDELRRFSFGAGATVAPAYLKLCNGRPWCLKEWLGLYGGEAHLTGGIYRGENGTGLSADLSFRLLAITGHPTAWNWWNLKPEEVDVHHLVGSAGGFLRWRFF